MPPIMFSHRSTTSKRLRSTHRSVATPVPQHAYEKELNKGSKGRDEASSNFNLLQQLEIHGVGTAAIATAAVRWQTCLSRAPQYSFFLLSVFAQEL